MNIAIYYEQDGYGGVDTHLSLLINEWPHKDDRFIIISNSDNEGINFLVSKLHNPNVEISLLYGISGKIIGKTKLSKFISVLKTQIKFPAIFYMCIKKKRPDILFVTNGGYPGGLTNFLAALVGRVVRKFVQKTFLLIHHAPSANTNILHYYAHFLSIMSMKLNIPVITVSKASKTALEEQTPLKNISIIYNGINTSNNINSPRNFRTEFKIDSKKLIMGMIGPIDPHKGHATILDVKIN